MYNFKMPDISVTRWLSELQKGDSSAAQQLWEFLHQRLLRLAQQEVDRRSARGFDADDVALSAFDALCRAILQGRYDIGDRDELWRILAVVTVNKVRRRTRDENRIRRGGEFTRKSEELLESLASTNPDPSTVLMMQEECQQLLGRLQKRELQMVALLKVEGYTNEEVADQLGCSRRAIQRRLVIIRNIWGKEAL